MASKRHQRRKTCLGKRRHRTEQFARIAVRLTEDRNGNGLSQHTLAPYQCPVCGYWHIGHQKHKGQYE